MSGRPSAADLLEMPGALLTRTHLRELGLGRSAIDAIFKELNVIVFPNSTRVHVRVEDYLELVERSTYSDGPRSAERSLDRVPCWRRSNDAPRPGRANGTGRD